MDADALRQVLRAPCGLDLGGRTPEEIALSITEVVKLGVMSVQAIDDGSQAVQHLEMNLVMRSSLGPLRLPDSTKSDSRSPAGVPRYAATTQKPHPVLNALLEFLTHSNANIHRGVYQLSEDASDAYEKARNVADFIGVKDSRRVVFTRGTTESINLVAQAWLRPRLQAGDRIVLTEMEHHSNQILAVGCAGATS